MNNKTLLLSFFLSVIFFELFGQETKPNVVLIFIDDGGYADFGFQGSQEIKTPNIDGLAKEGAVFKQAYVTASTCGPSRAGLITGKYQQRFGYEENNVPGYMSKHSQLLGEEMGLPLDEKTMGEYMQDLGYQTAYFGKWHLGSADKYHPIKRGFHEFFGFRGGDRSYFPYEELPEGLFADKKMERGFGQFNEPTEYITDLLAKEAVNYIEKNKDNPFFVFLAFNAVHTPIEAREEDLEQFPELNGTRQKLAAMTLALDRACGKVLDKLKELNLDDNTLIVFTNDNGGPSDKNGSNNYPLSGTKSNHLEGGIRVPFILKWPQKINKGMTYNHPVSTFDLLPTFYRAGGGDAESLADQDGVDLIPYLKNEKEGIPHEILYWKKEGRATVREGDWKLIRHIDRPAELFNIRVDPGEQSDLAGRYPDKVKKMYKLIYNWELTLERPRWMLKRQYEKYDIDRMDRYRKVPSNN